MNVLWCLLLWIAPPQDEVWSVAVEPGYGHRSHVIFNWTPASTTGGRLLLEGHIERKGETIERVKMHVVRGVGEPVLFSRFLVSDDYAISLKLTNRHKELIGKLERSFQVSRAEVAESHRVLPRIRPPKGAEDQLMTGKESFELRDDGFEVDHAVWFLDGKPVGKANKAPFKERIALGKAPLPHDVQVVVYDSQGRPTGADRLQVNLGPYAFAVFLARPHPKMVIDRPFLVDSRLHIPPDKELERIDFYVGNNKKATVYGEPYHVMFNAPSDQLPFDVRAVVHLNDGATTEARVPLNYGDGLPGLEVRNVDLQVTVVNQKGLPVSGFGRDQFSIFEDNKPMRLDKFEPAATQPLSIHFLLDVSGSMHRFFDPVFAGTRDIITKQLGPQDRMGLIVFRDEPEVIEAFSSDQQVLLDGLEKVDDRAHDLSYHGSAIFDSIATSLHHFTGVSGRRAMVIFSDGLDNRSKYLSGEVVDFAKQAGVRLYVFDIQPEQANFALRQLAEETGGSYYKVNAPSRVPALFDLMAAELRMQYLLRYQSSREPGDRDCRKIEVKLAQAGFEARTMKGYCP